MYYTRSVHDMADVIPARNKLIAKIWTNSRRIFCLNNSKLKDAEDLKCNPVSSLLLNTRECSTVKKLRLRVNAAVVRSDTSVSNPSVIHTKPNLIFSKEIYSFDDAHFIFYSFPIAFSRYRSTIYFYFFFLIGGDTTAKQPYDDGASHARG